jgi:hypothetical protein
MLPSKFIIIIYFITNTTFFYSQKTPSGFILPLENKPIITGNYGEIRPNHFHAGLDFTTDPIKNLPIKCVYDGYVSRIKISSVGYGKALYITHPNGYVSVYAHQKKYADQIETYIQNKQVTLKQNEIDVTLKPHELIFKKGDIIGYTGNTGGSTGPHLHFEIRHELTEIPINPLLIYKIKDDIKPIITHISLYDAKDTNDILLEKIIAVKNSNNKLSLLSNSITISDSHVAIAYAGYDVLNGTTNKNNIYEVKLSVDNTLIYHHQLNNISFDNGRFVNVFSEKSNGIKLQKCFTPTFFSIDIYKDVINNGVIHLNDTLFHLVNLEVNDENNNKNSLSFYLKTKSASAHHNIKNIPNAFCNLDFTKKEIDYMIQIKAGSLAENTTITLQKNKSSIKNSYQIKSTHSFLMKPMTMSLKIEKVLEKYKSKLVMLCNQATIGGIYENGWLTSDTKTFGTFSYSYDTIAPNITLLKPRKKINLNNSISFKIKDDLSGIKEYHLYLNNEWTITEYDAKTEQLTCYFNKQTPTGKIALTLEVTDKVNNKNTFKTKLER